MSEEIANSQAKSNLEKVETLSKILSSVAIPIVVALGGWWIQNSISNQSVSKDYVSLAITILQKPSTGDDQELRNWAIEIINTYSPTKFKPETIKRLQSGTLDLPGFLKQMASMQAPSNALAVSPDGKFAAIGRSEELDLYDVDTGRLVRKFTVDGYITGVGFTPDVSEIVASNVDNLITWDMLSGQRKGVLRIGDIEGFTIDRAGQKALIYASNNLVSVDLSTMRITGRLRIRK